MYENILSNMLGCQTYCISDSPSNRYCFIGPIECNEKLIEVFKKPSVEIRGQDKTGACVQHRPLHDFREIY